MKFLKNIIVLLIFLMANQTVNSQINFNNIKKLHEIRFSVGAVWDIFSNDDYYDNCCWYPDNLQTNYLGNKIGTPSLNLSYSYQFKKWLSFGAVVNYIGLYQKSYNIQTDAVFSNIKEHFIGITPTVRFDWYRSNLIKLYSNIGIGVGLEIYKMNITDSEYNNNDHEFWPTIDLTPIGISVGKKFFVFGEMGLSTNGFFKFGVGYRIKDNKK